MYEEVKQTKYLKKYKGNNKDCLCFTIGELSFEFVYYYDQNDNNLLNIVFNGQNLDVKPVSKNISDFEFFEYELERKNFVIDKVDTFERISCRPLATTLKILDIKLDETFPCEAKTEYYEDSSFNKISSVPQRDIAIKNPKELGKKLGDKLDHITLHPISRDIRSIRSICRFLFTVFLIFWTLKNPTFDIKKILTSLTLYFRKLTRQRINLYLSDKSQELIHSYKRNDPIEDPMLWFFLNNSFINSKDTSNEVTGLVLGRNLDDISTSAQLGGGWNLSDNKISKFKAEELFELSKVDEKIKPEDNFMFLIKKVGIPAFSPKQLKAINFKPKYLYDLKEYAK